MEYVETAFGVLIRGLVLWLMWQAGNMVRQTIRPPIMKELCRVRTRLEKVQDAFDNLEAKLTTVALAKAKEDYEEEAKEMH